MVLDLELLGSNIPVEEDVGEVQEAAEGELGGWRSAMDPMDERYDDYLDGDQRPPDQRTPPNTPPPQVEGGGSCRGGHGHCIRSERGVEDAPASHVRASFVPIHGFGHNNQPSGILEAQPPEEASAT